MVTIAIGWWLRISPDFVPISYLRSGSVVPPDPTVQAEDFAPRLMGGIFKYELHPQSRKKVLGL